MSNNTKNKQKIYVVSWNEEPERISKKTGKPVKEYYQTINPIYAQRVYEARIQAGRINVELTELYAD